MTSFDDPLPYLRGTGWPGEDGQWLRADPADHLRMPVDTWQRATLPVGLRVEATGDVEAVEIAYRTGNDGSLPLMPVTEHVWSLWHGDRVVDEAAAQVGESVVRLRTPGGDGRWVVYVPEVLQPVITGVRGVGGHIAPAPPQRRWVVYGDSISEGWSVTRPALAWPAVVGRTLGLDVLNLGYAGAARGEIVSAEHVAAAPADLLGIAYGTNCWSRIPHSVGMVLETTRAFLEIVRGGHPDLPLLVMSPVIRPDAETTPNKLGATLQDLRRAVEAAAEERILAGDTLVTLVRGGPVLEADDLVDGVHPGDGGHARMAGAALAAMSGW